MNIKDFSTAKSPRIVWTDHRGEEQAMPLELFKAAMSDVADAERDKACAFLMLMHAKAQESPFAHNYYECAADKLRKNDHRP